jgi:radical SAM protein with 4Fe4S-binding SPASM domain
MDMGFVYYVKNRWPKFQPSIIKKDAWIDFTDADNPVVPDTPCTRWWELNVTATGKVATCCMHDGDDERWIIGDLNHDTLLGVYNSPKWKDRRDKLVSRKALDDTAPCSRCSY